MRQAGRFLMLCGAMLLVYSVGGYLAAIPHGARTAIKCALPLVLLLLTCASARFERLRPWKPVSIALLAASCGFLTAWLLSDRLLAALGVLPHGVSGIALTKLSESTLIVAAAWLVARAGGMTRADLYLQRGKIRAWLPVGVAAFAVFSGVFLMQWTGAGLAIGDLVSALPWILMFVGANGFMEEFHFRGLLLRPFEGQLGRGGANACIALSFTLAHAPATYVPSIVPFLAVLLVLAWAWGFLIQRTDSLWGAVLFHAGADLLVVLGIFAPASTP
jgi:membrane protease YdiL (CAAX protease family)